VGAGRTSSAAFSTSSDPDRLRRAASTTALQFVEAFPKDWKFVVFILSHVIVFYLTALLSDVPNFGVGHVVLFAIAVGGIIYGAKTLISVL
jgi:hypothetical protein